MTSNVITDENDDKVMYEPEDYDACGCPSRDFEDDDCVCGVWVCPECGASQ